MTDGPGTFGGGASGMVDEEVRREFNEALRAILGREDASGSVHARSATIYLCGHHEVRALVRALQTAANSGTPGGWRG